MHLLRDQKAPPRCEVGGEKSRVAAAREGCRAIKQKERKHVEPGGLARRGSGVRAQPVVPADGHGQSRISCGIPAASQAEPQRHRDIH